MTTEGIYPEMFYINFDSIFKWIFELKSGEFFLIISTLALVLATIGLCYYTKKLVENKKIDQWFEIYFEYNKRFADIMMEISELKCISSTKTEDSHNERLLPLMRSYFNLCLEEYTLEQKKLLDDTELWAQWRQGISNYMQEKDFRSSWEQLRNNRCYPESFRIYMDNIKNKKENEKT